MTPQWHGSSRVALAPEPVNIYEAVLIDRGDLPAQALGELRTAAQLALKYGNSLGRIDGGCNSEPVVTAAHGLCARKTHGRPTEPMQIRCDWVRKYQRPSTSAGLANVCSPSRFTCRSLKSGAGSKTNVSPSSLVK